MADESQQRATKTKWILNMDRAAGHHIERFDWGQHFCESKRTKGMDKELNSERPDDVYMSSLGFNT
jgi:hypothetical protein